MAFQCSSSTSYSGSVEGGWAGDEELAAVASAERGVVRDGVHSHQLCLHGEFGEERRRGRETRSGREGDGGD